MSKDFTVIPPRTDISPITTIEKGENHIEIKIGYTQAVIAELTRKANAALDAAVMDRLAKQHGYMKRETCKNEWAKFGKFRCSECWLQVDSISTNTTIPQDINFCPNCGREVISDD